MRGNLRQRKIGEDVVLVVAGGGLVDLGARPGVVFAKGRAFAAPLIGEGHTIRGIRRVAPPRGGGRPVVVGLFFGVLGLCRIFWGIRGFHARVCARAVLALETDPVEVSERVLKAPALGRVVWRGQAEVPVWVNGV